VIGFTKIGDWLNMAEVLEAMMFSIAQYMDFQNVHKQNSKTTQTME
jgi:hypothetical protein